VSLSHSIDRILRRQEQRVGSDVPQAGATEQPARSGGSQQHSVVVHFGSRDHQSGQRIPWVVFDDDESSAWPENSDSLSYEIPPRRDWDMVDYGHGETVIERSIRERQPGSVIRLIINIPISDGGLVQGIFRDIAAGDIARQVSVQQSDPASDIQNVAGITVAKPTLEPLSLASDKHVMWQAEQDALDLSRIVGRVGVSPSVGIPHAP
jgi:hypothetical protein